MFLFLLQTDVLPFVLPFVIFLFYGFWIPQIVRNAERGTKGAFSWWYILGTTAARCWPLGYFWSGWGENVMFLERSSEFGPDASRFPASSLSFRVSRADFFLSLSFVQLVPLQTGFQRSSSFKLSNFSSSPDKTSSPLLSSSLLDSLLRRRTTTTFYFRGRETWRLRRGWVGKDGRWGIARSVWNRS